MRPVRILLMGLLILGTLGGVSLPSPAEAHDFNPLPVGIYKVCGSQGCTSFGRAWIRIGVEPSYGFTTNGGTSWSRGDYDHPETGDDPHVYWLSGPLVGLETTHGVCCAGYYIFVTTPQGSLKTFLLPF